MAAEENAAAPDQPKGDSAPKPEAIERCILRPYPKVVFFYLTWVAALVCGIAISITADESGVSSNAPFWTRLFLWVFTFNLLVVAFEFSRMLSVAVLFLVLAFVFLGAWLDFLSGVFGWLKDIEPTASAQFFFFIFIVFTVVFLLVFIQTRFNYFIVRRNELLHKHGFLGDVKRYQAQDVKIDKEIPDVLEFLLLRSGSMVIHAQHEQRAIVLENVIGINRKEAEVKAILESYAVRIEK